MVLVAEEFYVTLESYVCFTFHSWIFINVCLFIIIYLEGRTGVIYPVLTTFLSLPMTLIEHTVNKGSELTLTSAYTHLCHSLVSLSICYWG